MTNQKKPAPPNLPSFLNKEVVSSLLAKLEELKKNAVDIEKPMFTALTEMLDDPVERQRIAIFAGMTFDKEEENE